MNMKKVLAGAVASVMAVSSLAVVSSADGEEFTWEIGAQFDSSYNDAEEWPAGPSGTAKVGEEFTITWEFDDDVKLAANYFGIKTVGVAWDTTEGAENPTADIISFKLDGKEIAIDNDIIHKNCTDNDSAAGNLKIAFYNAWDSNISGNGAAFDVEAANGEEGFSKMEITLKVNGVGGSAEAPAATEANAGEGTQAPADNNATAAAPADKNQPDTGVEGVAVVAGLAVLATGAIVISKKRK